MIAVFGYLTWRSIRNRIKRQVRHIRNPRYLAACLLGGAYLWMILIHRQTDPAAAAIDHRVLELIASVLLAGAVLWAWVFGVERRVLAFSPAEVTFLFPAPVTRRELIQYKLLRTQLLILFNTLLWTLVLAHDRFGLGTWLRACSIWVLLTTLSFHRLGASFVRTSLAEHGRFGARARMLSLLVVAIAVVAVSVSIADALPALGAAWEHPRGLPVLLDALHAAALRPLPQALLLPFRVMIRPLGIADLAPWLAAAAPAAGIMLVHYVWVIRADASFEETAARVSLDRAHRVAKRASGDATASASVHRAIRPPFQLSPVGWPGGAIVWKNLVAAIRTQRVRQATIALALMGMAAAALSFSPNDTLAGIAGWLAVTWAGALVVIGPQWIRYDFRGDLLKLDLLRSYPIRGRTVVAAEVAASALVLTLTQLSLLVFAYLAFLGNGAFEFSLGLRTACLAGAVVCLPAVNFMGMLIQNGAALLFPDWVRLGSTRPGGIEALGQNMLAMVAFVVVLALALAVPAGIGGVLFVALASTLGLWAAAPAAVVAVAAVGAEAKYAVDWLGKIFDRTDPPSTL